MLEQRPPLPGGGSDGPGSLGVGSGIGSGVGLVADGMQQRMLLPPGQRPTSIWPSQFIVFVSMQEPLPPQLVPTWGELEPPGSLGVDGVDGELDPGGAEPLVNHGVSPRAPARVTRPYCDTMLKLMTFSR